MQKRFILHTHTRTGTDRTTTYRERDSVLWLAANFRTHLRQAVSRWRRSGAKLVSEYKWMNETTSLQGVQGESELTNTGVPAYWGKEEEDEA